MKKFLDILLIVLVTVMVVNYFNAPDKKETSGVLSFEATDSSYTIPASVGLDIKNKSANVVKLNTCDSIVVNYAGTPLVFPKEFCSDISVEPGDSFSIDYNKHYNLFTGVGNYVFKINIDDKEHISQFEIDHKNSFSKLFVALFYAPLYNLLVFLMSVLGGSLGFAIIAITVIIRLVLLYPQHKMMVSQKKLQAVQPKIKEIQEKYKGQQQVLGMKLMELYKKEKVNPMGSCGILLIQMPILIVVYNIILSSKDPANYYYIYNVLTSFDITSVSFNFFGIDLLASGGITGVVLAVTVGALQFFQIKLSLANNKKNSTGVVLEKKKDSKDYSSMMPDPEMMNKFMLYGMPAMVLVFTYTLIAGVGIYWGISTLFMLLQQLFVNKVLKK